ncbi:DUF6083 domain-containing protein [Streptomyces sp. NPDC091217]|uniref:DUF6083 domain-containing protein n=1 Tax=Streptomyces sp. NPDC091217 TaxID=3365975 RepID=UPI0038147AE8
MGATRDGDQSVCLRCGEAGGSVRERGRISLMASYCQRCWDTLANEMAEADGATATPSPEPDPDDVTWIEPPVCPECGALIRVCPTTYDRWVSLAVVELPAKDVPEAFRWRLMRLPTRSPIPANIVAVRVRGIDPLPGEPVVPAHSMMCVPEWGEP